MFKKIVSRVENRIQSNFNQEVPPSLFSLEWVLAKMALVYETSVRTRFKLYEKKYFKTKRLLVPVISIGNAVVGGTGKTPMAIYLANLLQQIGKKPAVISRGYKGAYQEKAKIITDGNFLMATSKEAGDEPYMMAQTLSFPVVVGKDRAIAGSMACEQLDSDILILDDGFQHIRLERDIDLLLMDYEQPFGNMRYLPAGRLREGPDLCLPRAQAFVFTRSDVNGDKKKGDEHPDSIQTILEQYPDTPWFKTDHVPFLAHKKMANNKVGGPESKLEDYSGKKALIFSGLAQNRSFYKTCRKAGIIVMDHLEFSDHYRYKDADILQIKKIATAIRAELILTTQKDWVKLEAAPDFKTDLVVVGINIQFEDPDGFEQFIRSRLNK